jgi:hypothetical protein
MAVIFGEAFPIAMAPIITEKKTVNTLPVLISFFWTNV